MFPPRTPRFDAFIEPARAYPQIWRLCAAIAIIAVCYFSFTLLVFFFVGVIQVATGIDFQLLGAAAPKFDSPYAMLALLVTFAGVTLGVWLAVRLLHKRGLLTVFGPNLKVLWRQASKTAHIIVPLFTFFLVLNVMFNPPVSYVEFFRWALWLPLALPLLLIQTSAEEILFRGYLMQQLAARFSSRWVWMVLPSVAFGLMHYNPAELGSNVWLVVIDTAIVGIIAADLTARSGTLGPAITFHFFNNLFAMFLMSVDGSMIGLALYVTPYTAADTETLRSLLLVDIVFNLVGYLIYARIMTRRGL